ncbi:DUF2268 domain-containing putative Zn-dependent protease [Phenylobacterium sp.]|uniref:DUF2268 domain-containing putative Zn-dependent protease n=1 Tax=Phenylobacterium sp. TaxID=1871053 RepID=UPI0035B2B234
MFRRILTALALACVAGAAGAQPAGGPVVEIGDVARFYEIYDAAGGKPTAEQLQAYLDGGSDGLKTLARVRRVTGQRIADNIAAQPAVYEDARRCAAVLPAARKRLQKALTRLAGLYPQARFPAVTVAVGRGRPVAVGSPVTGVQVGLEALCATEVLNPDIEDRVVYVLAHEFAHVQQAPSLTEKETPTVLEASLIEGAAEFVAEQTAGKIAYVYLPSLAAGRELEIETAFLADIDKTDLSAWLYNTAPGKPGDLGYWVGYRIAKAYYQGAKDKRRAFREILEMSDAKAFLAASGWRPGMKLD